MALNSSFVNIPENPFDRTFGGINPARRAEPYISGFHFIAFPQIPAARISEVMNIVNPGSAFDSGQPEILSRMLAGACLSVTPPGATLNKAEFNGLGGKKWSVPTNFDYGTTVSVRFLEYSGLPILGIFNAWFRLIRDNRTGVSTLPGYEYNKAGYAGNMLYWTTKPDGVTVEYFACYSGIYPTKDPSDAFSSDIATNDKLEIDIEFNLDDTWRESWVKDACQAKAGEYRKAGIAYHGHTLENASVPGSIANL